MLQLDTAYTIIASYAYSYVCRVITMHQSKIAIKVMIAGTPKIKKRVIQQQVAMELKTMTRSEDLLDSKPRPSANSLTTYIHNVATYILFPYIEIIANTE